MRISVSINLELKGDALASPYLEWEISRIFDEIVTPYVKKASLYRTPAKRSLYDLSGKYCGRLKVEIHDSAEGPR